MRRDDSATGHGHSPLPCWGTALARTTAVHGSGRTPSLRPCHADARRTGHHRGHGGYGDRSDERAAPSYARCPARVTSADVRGGAVTAGGRGRQPSQAARVAGSHVANAARHPQRETHHERPISEPPDASVSSVPTTASARRDHRGHPAPAPAQPQPDGGRDPQRPHHDRGRRTRRTGSRHRSRPGDRPAAPRWTPRPPPAAPPSDSRRRSAPADTTATSSEIGRPSSIRRRVRDMTARRRRMGNPYAGPRVSCGSRARGRCGRP